MSVTKRRCAGCPKVITGRADRIWCSDACRVRVARSPNGNVRARGPVETVIKGSNGKLIAAVARLGYLGHFIEDDVLDITYGKGSWWTHYRPVRLAAHDLHTLDGVDFRHLPEADGSRRIVCYDPPYISTGSRNTSSVDDLYDRFGLGAVKGWQAIRELIDDGLAECARILAPGGYLLVKCMDYTESGHKVWNTFHVAHEGERLGLRLIDRFHHLTGGGPQVTTNLDGSPREQQHAREITSMLLIFTKRALR